MRGWKGWIEGKLLSVMVGFGQRSPQMLETLLISCNDDRFGENEESRIDLEPDLSANFEDVHSGRSDGGDVMWFWSYVMRDILQFA